MESDRTLLTVMQGLRTMKPSWVIRSAIWATRTFKQDGVDMEVMGDEVILPTVTGISILRQEEARKSVVH